MNSPHPQSLRHRLQQRYEYARVLHELSRRQQELIDEGEYDQLIGLLQQKQTVLEALQESPTTEQPLPIRWKQERDFLNPTDRQQCERWLEQSERWLAEVLEREQSCTAGMLQRREQTQSQLAAVSGSLIVHDAYNDLPESSQFDMNR